MPESIEEDLRSLIPGDLGGVDPYFFRAEISSGRLDSYYTRMAVSTLKNFAKDATAGVAFLDSHDKGKLGFGRSLQGHFNENRVIADFYTAPGIEFGGQHSYKSTDDFIRALQFGLVNDVSVGFYEGQMMCDICGHEFYDFANCQHWPGQTYEVEESEVISTFTNENGRLAEVSAVYDGATPGAMILRAEGMAEAGLLDGEEIRRLETQYRIKIPVGQRLWATEAATYTGLDFVELENGEKQQMDELDDIRQILELAGVKKPDARIGVSSLIDERDRLKKANDELGPLAVQGKQYRADLTEEAIVQGIRANGKEFTEAAQATYRKMFETADVSIIKQMSADWQRQGDKIFKGERLTVDSEEQSAPTPAPVDAVPDAAYRS